MHLLFFALKYFAHCRFLRKGEKEHDWIWNGPSSLGGSAKNANCRSRSRRMKGPSNEILYLLFSYCHSNDWNACFRQIIPMHMFKCMLIVLTPNLQ